MSTKTILSIVSLLSVLSISLAGSSIKIQVFEDVLFQGQSKFLLPFKNCLDLNGMWDNRISSVRVHSGCVILCEDPRCKGRCEKIFPGTNAHHDFTILGINDKISSYKNCDFTHENEIPVD